MSAIGPKEDGMPGGQARLRPSAGRIASGFRPVLRLRGRASGVALALGLALVIAEAVTLLAGPSIGVAGYGIFLLVLLAVPSVARSEDIARLSVAMSLIPLVRMASLAIPARIVPMLNWYVEIGIVAFVGIGLVMRRLRLSPRAIGIRSAPVAEIAPFAVAGGVLALPGYLIIRPSPLVAEPTFAAMVIASLVIILFVGVLEEVLLRGVIQRIATDLLSRGGIIVSIAVTALLYTASLDVRYVLWAAFVGGVFAVAARRSGSLAAPIAGHSVLALIQLVVLPILLQ
jgi:membrane protease YdiL (CAAX protease family)